MTTKILVIILRNKSVLKIPQDQHPCGIFNLNLMMKNIDLHIHSSYSDGENRPEEIFQKILTRGIGLFSLTDHNFILEDNTKIKELARLNGILFIEGIEISSIEKTTGISLHILGYSKCFDKQRINKALAVTVDDYNTRAKKIIAKLNSEFLTLGIDFDEIKRMNNEVCVSRNTLARVLVAFLNKSITIKEALKKYVFVDENDSWMLSSQEAFEKIRVANGISVLAHSGRELRRMGNGPFEKMIEVLKAQGLVGIEVYHPKHTPQDVSELKRIALKNNLVVTGGSDWHGANYSPDSSLGIKISKKEIELFLRSIAVHFSF